MADFTNTHATIQSVSTATNVLNAVRSSYAQDKAAQALINLYLAGTNPTFNMAIDAMFSPDQRAELAAMLADINARCTNWEANHRSALGLEPLP